MRDFWSIRTQARDEADINGDGLLDERDGSFLRDLLDQDRMAGSGTTFVPGWFTGDLNGDGRLDTADLDRWNLLWKRASCWKLKGERRVVKTWLGNRSVCWAELHDTRGEGAQGPVYWVLKGENQVMQLEGGWRLGPIPDREGWLLISASWYSEGELLSRKVLLR